MALAQSFGLDVIAEGVGSEEQRIFLAASRCHAYQDYLFSRPVPLAAFEVYVKELMRVQRPPRLAKNRWQASVFHHQRSHNRVRTEEVVIYGISDTPQIVHDERAAFEKAREVWSVRLPIVVAV